MFHPVWLAHDDDPQIREEAIRETESLVADLVAEALAPGRDGNGNDGNDNDNDNDNDNGNKGNGDNGNGERTVAVLVRARKHLEGVLGCLGRRGLPSRAVQLEALTTAQDIDAPGNLGGA